jgi:hypothetical protein
VLGVRRKVAVSFFYAVYPECAFEDDLMFNESILSIYQKQMCPMAGDKKCEMWDMKSDLGMWGCADFCGLGRLKIPFTAFA